MGCIRCGQKLITKVDQERGYDEGCREILNEAIKRLTRIYSPAQIKKAATALRDGSIAYYDGDTFRCTSGTTDEVYWTTPNTCSCPASRPCYHMCGVSVKLLTPVS